MKQLLSLIILSLFISCESSTEAKSNPLDDKLLIQESTLENTEISIYKDFDPIVGYNTFYVQLKDLKNNKIVKDASVTAAPLMNMPTMSHSAPIENPDEISEDGIYKINTSFIMSGMWNFKINYHNKSNDDEGEINLSFDVAASQMVKKVTGSDNKTYFITLIYDKMKVGLNDIEFLVNERATMMSFPCVENLSFSMTPTMPSMGHGSPNNENPKHFEKGHYMGKVNFSMSGDWKIDLSISASDNLSMNTNYEISL